MSQSPVTTNAINATGVLKLALQDGNFKKIVDAMGILTLAMTHLQAEYAKTLPTDSKSATSPKRLSTVAEDTPVEEESSADRDLREILASYGILTKKFDDYHVVTASFDTLTGVKYRSYITHLGKRVVTKSFDVNRPGTYVSIVETYNTTKEAVVGWQKHCENFEKHGLDFYTKA